MSEEIRIKVIQENQGDALKKASEDAEKLKSNGGKAALATPPPNINAPQPPSKQQATQQRREAQQRNKALIADAEEDLAKARAKGAPTKDLENQVREQKLAARFMREQGLADEPALKKAQNLVALQNEAKEREHGAKQQAGVEKAAAKDAAADKKQQEAADKQAASAKRAEEKKAAAEAASAKKKSDAESTKELHEQNIVLKARESHMMRVSRAGSRLVERVAGTSPLAGLSGAAMTPQGMIAAAIAAVTVGVAMSYGRRLEGQAVLGAEMRGERAVQARRLRRQAGFEGTAGSNREMAEGYRDDLEEAKKEQGVLEEKKAWRVMHPTEWISDLTGEADAPLRANAERQKLDVANAAKSDEQKRQKYAEQVAPLIEAQRRLNEGDARGSRALEDQVARIKEKNRLLGEGATEAEAEAGANVKMGTIERERAQSFAKLVSARDGVADTARAAEASRSQRAESQLDAIHQTMLQQHGEASAILGRKNFSRS